MAFQGPKRISTILFLILKFLKVINISPNKVHKIDDLNIVIVTYVTDYHSFKGDKY